MAGNTGRAGVSSLQAVNTVAANATAAVIFKYLVFIIGLFTFS
jgi:hypothetical protein